MRLCLPSWTTYVCIGLNMCLLISQKGPVSLRGSQYQHKSFPLFSKLSLEGHNQNVQNIHAGHKTCMKLVQKLKLDMSSIQGFLQAPVEVLWATMNTNKLSDNSSIQIRWEGLCGSTVLWLAASVHTMLVEEPWLVKVIFRYSDVRWAPMCLISVAVLLSGEKLVWANHRESVKFVNWCRLVRMTAKGKGQWCGQHFIFMASSCCYFKLLSTDLKAIMRLPFRT